MKTYGLEYINHWNPLIRYFFRIKLRIAIKLVRLKKDDVILDFGCGGKWLKSWLKDYNVISYDINPIQTEVKDYTTVNPTIIFALDVLEHIEKNELRKTIQNFKKMSNNFTLITLIPNENKIWFLARKILRLPIMEDHITTLKEILEILNSELRHIKTIKFLRLTYISKWKNC